MPVSDFNWDDGYYFGVYNGDEGIFLYTGLRVTPNADMVGCYAGVSVKGHQTTFRASRVWRPDYATAIGPYRFEVIEPYREIRLVLEPNESGVEFDLRWLGLAPAHIESHHFARKRGRITTDQTRYTQSGTAEGWIQVGDKRWDVRPHEWYADRDHSWGLYEPRAPLSDPSDWLPPAEEQAKKRMLRFWMPFQSPDLSRLLPLPRGRARRGRRPERPVRHAVRGRDRLRLRQRAAAAEARQGQPPAPLPRGHARARRRRSRVPRRAGPARGRRRSRPPRSVGRRSRSATTSAPGGTAATSTPTTAARACTRSTT